MKLKKFLAFAISLAMVLSVVPAFSLTASAATSSYNATAFGHSGSASGTGVFVGVAGGSQTSTGSADGAPKTSTTCSGGSGLGSTRVGYISFSVAKPAIDESVQSATMKFYVSGVNGNLGSSWMKLAAYRTTGTPSSVKVGNMTASEYPAVNNDYSYNAAYWTNEQISKTNLGWKTIDVTNAVKAAISEASEDTVTVSFRLQVPTAGLNIATASTNAANQPVLEVKTAQSASTTIKFVSSVDSSVEVADPIIVDGVIGDVINLSSYGEATYTYNGNLYSRDETNITTHTVITSSDVVTLTYTTDAVASFESVAATVVEGNDPVLPVTINGITSSNVVTPVNVTWFDYTNLGAGTHTITGKADGISAKPTATVTVLPMQFDVADLSSTNGKVAYSRAFPAEVVGNFAFEFDYVSSQNGDDWIYISQNAEQSGMWSGGNLAIGVGNNKLNAPTSLGGTPSAQISTFYSAYYPISPF